MDSVNRITEETPVEGSSLNVNKDKDVLQVNDASEDLLNGGGLNSSGMEVEASATTSASKSLSLSKKPGADHVDGLKKNQTSKAQAVGKGQTAISRNQKPSLSKSISFPSKQSVNNSLKNNDGKLVKTDAKNSRVNGTEAECSGSNGSVSSHKRRVSSGGSSMDANSNGRRSASGKPGSVNATADAPPSEVSESNYQNLKPIARLSLIKDEEDAHSTTSSITPRGSRRSSGSEFTFRVVERAEKRKEFYSKLEEKFHAKEVERKSLQEKSKESQEAEIKQLRKSMTFVATPMPSFYREPPPSKVEPKKIPTTRPISPKLGRHIKIAIAASDNSSESGGVVESPRSRPRVDRNKSTKVNSHKDSVASKKPIQKSLSKLPSQKSRTTKTEAKPLNSKPNTRDPENLEQKVCRGETENQNKSTENPYTEAKTELDAIKDPVENETSLNNLASVEITPDEVSVKG
ncbi:TPX2 [Macleaya cordata]|uniref:TPX2 n=1 Tax=Macleaya cordata TaxID=56857 RepID=A0A200Q9R9_MACCD|nr:TPX2 [Macleaya cordata]